MTLSAEELEQDQLTFIISCCLVSSMALLAYDTIITMGDEVNHIWKRKFSGATLLFLLNRYCNLSSQIMNILQYYGPQTAISCQATTYVWIVFDIAALLVAAVFSAFRVWAIWGQRWAPFLVILLIGLVTPCINIYTRSQDHLLEIIPGPIPFGGCSWGADIPKVMFIRLSATSRASLIACDALVLVATLIKTLGIRQAAKHAGLKAGLSTLLIRSGALYFVTLLTLNVISVIFAYAGVAQINPVSYFNDALTCILITRFMLSLRRFDPIDRFDSMQYSTINFASSVLGNLGAPLDSSMSHSSVLRTTSKQMCTDPLSVGMFDDDSSIVCGTSEEIMRSDIETPNTNISANTVHTNMDVEFNNAETPRI